MRILSNEPLSRYTTFGIGGIARTAYVPESTDECCALLDELGDAEYRVLSGGSNLLINDSKVYDNVLIMTQMDNTIVHEGDGLFYVGASVRLQKLIDEINGEGFGGIEYLYSVPGRVGGSIVMNAGRGRENGLCIGDHIKEIKAYSKGMVRTISVEECGFAYRRSVFQHGRVVILGARFCFAPTTPEVGKKARKDRLTYARARQDSTSRSFGSVFMEKSGFIMHILRLLHPGYKGGVRYSGKTANWLVNDGAGTFDEAIRLIRLARVLHRLAGKKATPEVVIWD